MYLPQKVWSLYNESCSASRITPVAYTTFADYWLKLLPHIRVGKPMTDLCWVCQQNSTRLTRSMNKSEDEKSEVGIIVTEDKHTKTHTHMPHTLIHNMHAHAHTHTHAHTHVHVHVHGDTHIQGY